MAFAKLGSKGQITIPLEVRRKLGLQPGDRIDFVLEKSGEDRCSSHLISWFGAPQLE